MGRAKKPQNIDGNCCVCGYSFDAFFNCLVYPFIDGKKHPEVCFCCGSVPVPQKVKLGEQDIYLSGTLTNSFHTLKEMVQDGFDVEDATISIKAVGKAASLSPNKIKELLNSITQDKEDSIANLIPIPFIKKAIESKPIEKLSRKIPKISNKPIGRIPQVPRALKKCNLAILASGAGSTLKNLINNVDNGVINGIVRCVISNNPKSMASSIAKDHGIPYSLVKSEDVFHILDKFDIDLVLLAGYTALLKIPNSYAKRVLNIHPSLLPEFGGKGFYGIHVHKAVLEAKKLESGCTIHIVDNQYDHGTILAQQKVKVLPDDTPESLQKRIQMIEREFYPRIVQQYISGL